VEPDADVPGMPAHKNGWTMDGRMSPGAVPNASCGETFSQDKWITWVVAGIVTLSVSTAIVHAQAMGKVEVDTTPVASETSEKLAPQTSVQVTQTSAPVAQEHSGADKAREAFATASRQTDAAINNLSGGLSMPALPPNLGLGGSSAYAASAGPISFAPVNTPSTTQPAAPSAPATPAVPSNDPPAVKPQAQVPAVSTRAIEHMAIQKSAPATSQPAAGVGGSSGGTTSGTLWSGLGSLGQVGAALAIVIGLILVGKALARKFVPGARATNGKGVIEILARHPLAKNQSIVLVRIGSQLGAPNPGREASESILVISEPPAVANIIGQIEGQSPPSIQAGFNKLLANARMDLEQGDETTEQEPDLRSITPESLDEQLEEMAAAKRQLMELRQHVRTVRDSLPRA